MKVVRKLDEQQTFLRSVEPTGFPAMDDIERSGNEDFNDDIFTEDIIDIIMADNEHQSVLKMAQLLLNAKFEGILYMNEYYEIRDRTIKILKSIKQAKLTGLMKTVYSEFLNDESQIDIKVEKKIRSTDKITKNSL